METFERKAFNKENAKGKIMKNILIYTFGIALICGLIYGGYWIAKTVSYNIFYEDMVIETIKDHVDHKYLK